MKKTFAFSQEEWMLVVEALREKRECHIDDMTHFTQAMEKFEGRPDGTIYAYASEAANAEAQKVCDIDQLTAKLFVAVWVPTRAEANGTGTPVPEPAAGVQEAKEFAAT